MGGRDQSERLVAINRNGWSQSIVTAGRDHPVHASTSKDPTTIIDRAAPKIMFSRLRLSD
jgi:hypothetical protein